MDINEYARRKQSLLVRMIRTLIALFRQFLTPRITRQDWVNLMRAVYRVMKPVRDDVTELSRQFYDDNRAEQTGDDEQHDIFKDDYYPEGWMREALEPTYDNLTKTGNVEGAIQDISNRLVKVVEDGGRRTILRGVETEPTYNVRWSRFDPRPPTCAFCTMLISRGPVYHTAHTAGAQEDAESLMKSIHPDRLSADEAEELSELMNRWHPGCTCLVVPVYKLEGYPTQRQEEDAFEIYKKARKRAKEKTFKAILKEMRKDLYVPEDEQDEVSLPSSA